MVYKKIILLCALSLSLFAVDNTKSDGLFEYSDVNVNEGVSLYAGKTYMGYFEDSQGYSVGVLLHEDRKADTEFGVGYIQPCAQIDALWNTTLPQLDTKKEEGVLFFMSYFF